MITRVFKFQNVFGFLITLGVLLIGCNETPPSETNTKEPPIVKTTPQAETTTVPITVPTAIPVTPPVTVAEPCGTVELSKLKVVSGPGKKNLKSLSRGLKRRAKGFEFCYKKGLAETPGMKGEVVLRFELSATGAVTLARMTENTMGPTVGSCMLASAKRIVFPSSSGEPLVLEQRIEGMPCDK